MKCLLAIVALVQILPYIQCMPQVHLDHQNKTGSWAKLARRLDFESHLELPSRFMRRYAITPTDAPVQLAKRSVTGVGTRKFLRRTRSARAPAPSRRYHPANKTTIQPRAPAESLNMAPTPAPTGSGSSLTTVHITDEGDFALLLPTRPDELISDAESDAQAYCSSTSGPVCSNIMTAGFVTAAAISKSPNNDWIQVTGCIDPSKMSLDPNDDGGQLDVRFPNGAQCVYGGYGASFIEQVEPSKNRFCLRCCATANDQTNCNSHQDRDGCLTAIPGTYDFPEIGVSCS